MFCHGSASERTGEANEELFLFPSRQHRKRKSVLFFMRETYQFCDTNQIRGRLVKFRGFVFLCTTSCRWRDHSMPLLFLSIHRHARSMGRSFAIDRKLQLAINYYKFTMVINSSTLITPTYNEASRRTLTCVFEGNTRRRKYVDARRRTSTFVNLG